MGRAYHNSPYFPLTWLYSSAYFLSVWSSVSNHSSHPQCLSDGVQISRCTTSTIQWTTVQRCSRVTTTVRASEYGPFKLLPLYLWLVTTSLDHTIPSITAPIRTNSLSYHTWLEGLPLCLVSTSVCCWTWRWSVLLLLYLDSAYTSHLQSGTQGNCMDKESWW